jgi:hypothetical protein
MAGHIRLLDIAEGFKMFDALIVELNADIIWIETLAIPLEIEVTGG